MRTLSKNFILQYRIYSAHLSIYRYNTAHNLRVSRIFGVLESIVQLLLNREQIRVNFFQTASGRQVCGKCQRLDDLGY